MTPNWIPFRYRDFYDVPRAILLEYAGTLYFLDCPFSDERDDYRDVYGVYEVPEELRDSLDAASWEDFPGRSRYVGSVPVDEVAFDPTRRCLIDVRFIERLWNL